MSKLITVTRQDITQGYQTVQSVHAALEWAKVYPEDFKIWSEQNKYITSLAVKNENTLIALCFKLELFSVKFSKFYEPDIDEITAICFISNEHTKRFTSSMPLVNKNYGNIDKHINKREL